jgi:hypothetical protein
MVLITSRNIYGRNRIILRYLRHLYFHNELMHKLSYIWNRIPRLSKVAVMPFNWFSLLWNGLKAIQILIAVTWWLPVWGRASPCTPLQHHTNNEALGNVSGYVLRCMRQTRQNSWLSKVINLFQGFIKRKLFRNDEVYCSFWNYFEHTSQLINVMLFITSLEPHNNK